MIYLYRRAASESARDLAEALNVNCRRINDLGRAHFGNGVRAGDTVICWGEALPAINGVRILNGGPMRSKFEDATILRQAGVNTVEVSRTQPPPVVAQSLNVTGGQFHKEQARALVATLQAFINRPDPVAATWLPRRNNHTGGTDLLTPPTTPDYWSKKETFVNEFRVHCFKGLSIRAGKKTHREGFQNPHAWIRSHAGGWKIDYNDFHSKQSMREIAAAAIAALGLDFGAVDIGKRADRSLVVLEVNRGPGLEGGTTAAYSRAIENWLANAAR